MYLDIMENTGKFNKLTEDCVFCSYKYSLDSFGELNLEFSIENKHRKYKYYYLNIRLDAKKSHIYGNHLHRFMIIEKLRTLIEGAKLLYRLRIILRLRIPKLMIFSSFVGKKHFMCPFLNNGTVMEYGNFITEAAG